MKKRLIILYALSLGLFISMISCGVQSENANTTGNSESASTTTTAATATTTQAPSQTQANDESKYSPVGSYPIVNEPIVLTVLAVPTPNTVDLATNEMTKWVEEQTGVRFDWTVIDPGSVREASEKVNLMINSGEQLPDVLFCGLKNDQQQLYGDQGILMPLNDLIKDYCPTITDFFERFPIFEATSIRADGNIYTITGWEECFHCTVAQKMYINQKWLDNLGLTMPKTTDEFADVLRAFKKQDPNGNGQPDELPLSGFIDAWHSNFDGFLMNAFLYNDGQERMNVTDGKVYPAFTQPEWREGIKYYRMLSEEGLIDTQAFVQDNSTYKQLTSGDTIRVGATQAGHHGMICDISNPNINDFTALPPLSGPKGIQYSAYYPTTAKTDSCMVSLSASCSDPILAIRMIDFLFTEEATIRNQYGVKGVDWDYNDDPNVLDLTGKQALYHTFGKQQPVGMTQQNVAWLDLSPFGWEDRVWTSLAQIVDEGVFDLEKNLYDQSKGYIDYIPDEYLFPMSYDAETSRFISEHNSIYKAYVEEAFAQYVIGERDISSDSDWERYLSEINNMDLDQYITFVQAAYDKLKNILS